MTNKDWYDLGIKNERNRILGHISRLGRKTRPWWWRLDYFVREYKRQGWNQALHAVKSKIGNPL